MNSASISFSLLPPTRYGICNGGKRNKCRGPRGLTVFDRYFSKEPLGL